MAAPGLVSVMAGDMGKAAVSQPRGWVGARGKEICLGRFQGWVGDRGKGVCLGKLRGGWVQRVKEFVLANSGVGG
jgi:hypothetical protein